MHIIDHLGIAVKSLAQARKFYEQLGLEVLSEEAVPHEKVKVAMIPLGQSRIELLKVIGKRALRINVKRRSELLHEGFDRNSFAIQFAVDVAEIVHKIWRSV